MRKAEIILEYQNYVDNPPVTAQQQHQQACSNDSVTIESWRQTWVNNVKENHKHFGSFKDRSIGKIFKKHHCKPGIVIGSGPSLKYNAHLLSKRQEIPAVSCLHNFHFLEDLECHPDYYVTLDAGAVTLEEVTEGGKRSQEDYWALTKDRTLLAYIGAYPELLKKWKGEVLFYNAPIPDPSIQKAMNEVETFHCYVSNGGNVLGACMYIAKGFLGCNPIVFMGADFCFGYERKFHAWDSKYDANLGYVVSMVDVFGNRVLSWQSYANFKGWFEYVSRSASGLYINCTDNPHPLRTQPRYLLPNELLWVQGSRVLSVKTRPIYKQSFLIDR